MDATARFFFKAMLAEAGAGLALMYWLNASAKLKSAQRVLDAILVVAAVLGVAAFFEFGHFRYGEFRNPHDIFHYYLGAKYSDQVGYFDLYQIVALAQYENEGPSGAVATADMHTYGIVPAARVIARRQEYKGRFTEEEWREFKRDVAAIRAMTSEKRWRGYLRDLGYNATPVWNMIGGFIARRIPIQQTWGLMAVMSLDWIVMLLGLAAVGWAFGWRTMLFAVLFVGTNFMTHFAHMKGAFLRWDWVAALLIMLAMLKRGRYGLGGAALAYATAVRIFPLVFAFGLGAKAVAAFVRRREIRWDLVRFFAVCLVVVAVLVILSCFSAGSTGVWQEFSEKISLHKSQLTALTVGFTNILLWSEDAEGLSSAQLNTHRQEHLARLKPFYWTLVAVLLLLFILPVSGLEDYEAAAFGFCPAFLLFSPHFYYYAMLIVPFFLFAPKLNDLWRAAGLAGMFGVSVVSYILLNWWILDYPEEVRLCFAIAVMLLMLVVYVVIVGSKESLKMLRTVPLAEEVGVQEVA